jgi:hypothetical protein
VSAAAANDTPAPAAVTGVGRGRHSNRTIPSTMKNWNNGSDITVCSMSS